MFETSHIHLKKEALKNNLSFIRGLIGDDCQMTSVVKGNAYGHGIEEYVIMAEECGVTHFSVYSTDEAQRVFNVKRPNTAIMIMGSVDDGGLAWAIDNEIEFWVFDEERLNKALRLAEDLGKKAKLHIEIETGMYRTGFENGEIKTVIQTLQRSLEHHTLLGICTHFAGAESIANYYRIKEQIRRFKRALKQFEKADLKPIYRHACCSAALLRFPEMRMDMVRVGILQYGFWPSTETFIDYTQKHKTMDEPLHRIISWKSHVMSIKSVKTGEYIGYGTSYLAQRDTKIGIVPVGYGHGFARSLSNQGRALINGIRVAVIGTVNMNSLAVDLSEVETVKKGDSVTLIGKDGDLDVSVASFSEATNQLNYELLTRLPMHIPRIVE
ncbi:MAG: alanine racemase [Flavobacteriales bacterium]|nr:alanine racemase [Flavobacteriales bacterium]